MIWATPKNQTAFCSQVHLTMLISICDSQISLQVDKLKFYNNKVLRPTPPPPPTTPSSLAMRYSVTGMYIF